MSRNTLIAYARGCLNSGRVNAARQAADRVLDANPEDFDALVIKARCSALSTVQMKFCRINIRSA